MDHRKVLILGKGFIGTRICQELQCDIDEEMISRYEDAEKLVKKHNPKILINCIGFTGTKNVDGCEEKKNQTLLANVFIPIMLAEVALRHDIKFVHISSGCIYHYDFERDEPIPEIKPPDFFDLFYSRSKMYCEGSLGMIEEKYRMLALRLRIPLDDRPHPRNLLTKLISFGRVIDIPNSISYIPDFIEMLRHLIEKDAFGIYNTVNKGALRYPELLDVYKKYRPDFDYSVIPIKDLNLVRTNLVLSTEKLEKSGFHVRDINEILEECVGTYLESEVAK
ncbi:MAG: sugar nucleotide-binding protein [Candidatus Omnitrophica bacterium]|nr:sugar nucleotide-binding protein [Candidatus Omnitrophota bacterium]